MREAIDILVNAFKVCSVVRTKILEYEDDLSAFFYKQGELVLYPKNVVTSFKYRGVTYHNPKLPKLANNKIEIYTKNLHPSLHNEMNNLLLETNNVHAVIRQFESLTERLYTNFTFESDLVSRVLAETSVAGSLVVFYIINSFYGALQQQFGILNNAINYVNTNTNCPNLVADLTALSMRMRKNEKTTIDSINKFFFTTNVIGL